MERSETGRTSESTHVRNDAGRIEHGALWEPRRTSWGAIVTGTLVALAVQFLFALLGLSTGAAAIDPTTESNSLSGFSITAGVWTLAGVIAGCVAGGWVAGRMAGIPRSKDAIMYGGVVWALLTIISLYLITTTAGSIVNAAGGVVGGALRAAAQGVGSMTQAVSQAAPGAGQAIQQAVPDDATQQAQQRAQSILSDMGVTRETVRQFTQQAQQRLGAAAEQAATNPDQAYTAAQNALVDLYRRGQSTLSDVDRQDAARAIAQNTGLSQEQAARAVDQWSQQLQQLPQQLGNMVSGATRQLERAADSAAGAISAATGWLAAAYIVGLLAAIGGGLLGRPNAKRLEEEHSAVYPHGAHPAH